MCVQCGSHVGFFLGRGALGGEELHPSLMPTTIVDNLGIGDRLVKRKNAGAKA
jgi:hypothetical protein